MSSLDLNLHKHAKPHAHRQAVTLCMGLLRGGKNLSAGATPKLMRAVELPTPQGFQPGDTWMRIPCS